MADEVAQVVELEYKGVYYLLKGTHQVIAAMISGIRAISEWGHEKYLNRPGASTWQKIQEVSEGTAPVIEIPKEMLVRDENGVSSFERYCESSGLRYCRLPDLNPDDDYIPVGVPSQDLAIHQKQIKSWMGIRKEEEESKDKDYDKMIQEKREEIANAKTDEEREDLEGELAELVEGKEQNQAKLLETKEKMSHDNTITFEEYLRQSKGTNFEKNPEKALAMEPECGIIREFTPEECMIPIRDESLVPDSKEIFYSQKTRDDELFTIKRNFESDKKGRIYSVYEVTDSADPSKVRTFSDKGLSRKAWLKKLPEMLKYSGMIAGQPTTALSTEERLKAYIKGIDANFSKATEEGQEETSDKEYSSKDAGEYVENAKKDKKQADNYDESLYTTVTVPATSVMKDGEGKLSLELAGGLVSGVPVTSVSKKSATLKINSDDIFEIKSSEGEVSKIKGVDILTELTSGKDREQAKNIHHAAKR